MGRETRGHSRTYRGWRGCISAGHGRPDSNAPGVTGRVPGRAATGKAITKETGMATGRHSKTYRAWRGCVSPGQQWPDSIRTGVGRGATGSRSHVDRAWRECVNPELVSILWNLGQLILLIFYASRVYLYL